MGQNSSTFLADHLSPVYTRPMKLQVAGIMVGMVLVLTSCVSMAHMYAEQGDVAEVQARIADGVSPDARNSRGRTLLHIAAENRQMALVEYLVLDAGADVNATLPEESGEITPLRFAIGNQDYQMVQFLLENGASPSLANAGGWTPFMTAARVGNRDIMELLLEYGADIHARTEAGETALRVASNNGWTDIVVWLTLLIN